METLTVFYLYQFVYLLPFDNLIGILHSAAASARIHAPRCSSYLPEQSVVVVVVVVQSLR